MHKILRLRPRQRRHAYIPLIAGVAHRVLAQPACASSAERNCQLVGVRQDQNSAAPASATPLLTSLCTATKRSTSSRSCARRQLHAEGGHVRLRLGHQRRGRSEGLDLADSWIAQSGSAGLAWALAMRPLIFWPAIVPNWEVHRGSAGGRVAGGGKCTGVMDRVESQGKSHAHGAANPDCAATHTIS